MAFGFNLEQNVKMKQTFHKLSKLIKIKVKNKEKLEFLEH